MLTAFFGAEFKKRKEKKNAAEVLDEEKEQSN